MRPATGGCASSSTASRTSSGNDYYVLWLAKDGEYAGTCGTFDVSGRTTVDMTASYDLREYDAWVISTARSGLALASLPLRPKERFGRPRRTPRT